MSILPQRKFDFAIYISWLTTVVLLTGTALFWEAVNQNDAKKTQLVVNAKVAEVKNQIEHSLEERISSFSRMAKSWNARGYSEIEWREDVKNHLLDFPGIHVVSWADRFGIIQWIEPYEDTKQFIHYDLKSEERRRETFFSVQASKEAKITPILERLHSTEKVFAVYIPVFLKDQWNGVFIVGFRPFGSYNKFLSLNGYQVELIENKSGTEFFSTNKPDSSLVHRFASEQVFQYRNLNWKIKVTPDTFAVHAQSSYLSWIVLISGACISFLFGILSYFFLISRRAETKLANDMAEKKAQAAQLEEQRIKLVHASKFASLGLMAGGIAHEINNPLAIIYGKAQQIKLLYDFNIDSKDKILAHLRSIESTIERISKIISGLRSFAKDSDKAPFKVIEFRSIIEETLAFCNERFKNQSVLLSVFYESKGLKAECRSHQISQVILNLLNNAFDAASMGKDKWVKISVRSANEGIELSILDSGPGISPEIRDKIMLPFFTTKEIGNGMGLGLSISQGIISEHQGKLYLDESSKYTRFVIWIPAHQNKSIDLSLNPQEKAFHYDLQ